MGYSNSLSLDALGLVEKKLSQQKVLETIQERDLKELLKGIYWLGGGGRQELEQGISKNRWEDLLISDLFK